MVEGEASSVAFVFIFVDFTETSGEGGLLTGDVQVRNVADTKGSEGGDALLTLLGNYFGD